MRGLLILTICTYSSLVQFSHAQKNFLNPSSFLGANNRLMANRKNLMSGGINNLNENYLDNIVDGRTLNAKNNDLANLINRNNVDEIINHDSILPGNVYGKVSDVAMSDGIAETENKLNGYTSANALLGASRLINENLIPDEAVENKFIPELSGRFGAYQHSILNNEAFNALNNRVLSDRFAKMKNIAAANWPNIGRVRADEINNNELSATSESEISAAEIGAENGVTKNNFAVSEAANAVNSGLYSHGLSGYANSLANRAMGKNSDLVNNNINNNDKVAAAEASASAVSGTSLLANRGLFSNRFLANDNTAANVVSEATTEANTGLINNGLIRNRFGANVNSAATSTASDATTATSNAFSNNKIGTNINNSALNNLATGGLFGNRPVTNTENLATASINEASSVVNNGLAGNVASAAAGAASGAINNGIINDQNINNVGLASLGGPFANRFLGNANNINNIFANSARRLAMPGNTLVNIADDSAATAASAATTTTSTTASSAASSTANAAANELTNRPAHNNLITSEQLNNVEAISNAAMTNAALNGLAGNRLSRDAVTGLTNVVGGGLPVSDLLGSAGGALNLGSLLGGRSKSPLGLIGNTDSLLNGGATRGLLGSRGLPLQGLGSAGSPLGIDNVGSALTGVSSGVGTVSNAASMASAFSRT